MTRLPPFCVYLVTDRRQLAPASRTASAEIAALEAFLDLAIAAAVDVVQIRERDLASRALADLVLRVVGRARGTGTRVLVNDRADIVTIAGADGVHLPADGLSAAEARALSPTWTIGRSVHAGDTAAAFAGSDYLLFGSVFESASKPAAWRAAGLDALRRMTTEATMPVVAIGDMTPRHAEAAAAAGARGAAGIRVFLPPPAGLGPDEAVGALRAALAKGARRPPLLE